jgi:hypothetical protein
MQKEKKCFEAASKLSAELQQSFTHAANPAALAS